MLDLFRTTIKNQFEAALCTLNVCVDKCSDDAWNSCVARYAFCQVAFHMLFYADLYLGPDVESLARQPFHRENAKVFGDYEEFKDRAPESLYESAWIKTYLEHCRRKVAEVIAAETTETLSARCGFDWLKVSRAELHVYNIRHVQHHAAQLSLRLRVDRQEHVPWVGSGWRHFGGV